MKNKSNAECDISDEVIQSFFVAQQTILSYRTTCFELPELAAWALVERGEKKQQKNVYLNRKVKQNKTMTYKIKVALLFDSIRLQSLHLFDGFVWTFNRDVPVCVYVLCL